ncbi:myristoyl transferase [Hydrogenophaga crassostreae]|uniref:Myristoyl transferase n=2 Tax=Hydrogenophaga crassostreae TaxID=1763535 RepID=A0A162SW90_9BURK|nr:myristoyl transferase [Hydrogenophaga crassostreae]OAD41109.1 myristoyl transferase [Hydrogenophaga crassostreae]
MTRSLLSTFVAILLSLTGQAYAQTTTLKIQDYPGLGNFLVRVANANGICAKHNLKCELRTIPQAPLGVQTMLAGDIDVAYGPPEVMIQAINKGAEFKVLGNGAYEPIFFLMAAAGLDTPNAAKGYPAVIQDFKGKKIGVTARGAAAEFQLISLLQGAGMKADDVTIVAVGAPNTAFPAIANKQIDGLMLFSPMDGFCEVTKVCRVVVDPRKGEGPEDIVKTAGAVSLMMVKADFAQKNAAALDAFGKAMHEAQVIVQNPDNFAAMLKLAQETFKINVPNGDQILEVALRNSMPALRYEVKPEALQHAAEYMQRTGQIDKLVDTSNLIFAR